MRALRWVVTCTVLLAAATAYGAEPVKIRASWIVAPSDWTPLVSTTRSTPSFAQCSVMLPDTA